jgi:hypothetical protein
MFLLNSFAWQVSFNLPRVRSKAANRYAGSYIVEYGVCSIFHYSELLLVTTTWIINMVIKEYKLG